MQPFASFRLPGLQLTMLKGILFPKPLLARLLEERAHYLPNETGGYLLGLKRGAHIEITSATFQAERDIASPSSFERSDPKHYETAVAAWAADNGKTGYVGDWHSHPSGNGAPSNIDRATWSALSEHARADVVGLILGETPTFRLFRCSKVWRLLAIAECEVVEEDGADIAFQAYRDIRRW